MIAEVAVADLGSSEVHQKLEKHWKLNWKRNSVDFHRLIINAIVTSDY